MPRIKQGASCRTGSRILGLNDDSDLKACNFGVLTANLDKPYVDQGLVY